MAEQSYLLGLLADYGNLGAEYRTYIQAEVRDLEKIKEKYDEQCEMTAKLQ